MTMAPNYGTTQDTRRPNGSADVADAERAPLLGKPDEDVSFGQRFHKHMTENVSNAWGDVVLLGSYIITGLLDGCSVYRWGSFLSMQTGKLLEAFYKTGHC